MSNLNEDQGTTTSYANTGAVAGTTSTYTSTAASNAAINGYFETQLAAQTNAATPTTDWSTGLAFNALAPNQTCTLVFGISASGTLRMLQGPVIATAVGVTTTVGGFIVAPQFPGFPDDFVALAHTIVRTAPSAAPWTPGTSSWTASGVSASTFRQLSQIPKRPQVL